MLQRAALVVLCLVALASTTAAADITPMAFTVERPAGSPVTVFASGAILPETPAAFEAFLTDNEVPAASLVVMNSPGGDIDAGLALGRAIRTHGLSTRIGRKDGPGSCNSACSLAFLGGVVRDVPAGSKYAVHQVRINCTIDDQPADAEKCVTSGADAFANGLSMGARLAIYIAEMGADLDLLTELVKAGPNEANFLDRTQLLRLGVITAPAR